jgi:hypothetical protein
MSLDENLLLSILTGKLKKPFEPDDSDLSVRRYEVPVSHLKLGVDKSRYSMRYLLTFFDEDLLKVLYRTLLKRDPDVSGFNNYLAALRHRKYSRVELIARLRYSSEGKRQGVHVSGLNLAFFLGRCYRLPVLGWLLSFCRNILSLESLHRTIEGLNCELTISRANTEKLLAAQSDHYYTELKILASEIGTLRAQCRCDGVDKK